MSKINDIALIRELLESAEKSIKTAKQLLIGSIISESKKSISIPDNLTVTNDGNVRIIEGVFDGQNMRGADGRIYPVIANYASKSKLVEGDHLKLTILEDGSFVFKQIGPVERKSLVGVLIYDNGKYKVLANGKLYNVLSASVTYYKAKPGDEVTIFINNVDENTEWAAIDNVITTEPSNTNDKQLNVVDFNVDNISNVSSKKKKKKDLDELNQSDNNTDVDINYKIDL